MTGWNQISQINYYAESMAGVTDSIFNLSGITNTLTQTNGNKIPSVSTDKQSDKKQF